MKITRRLSYYLLAMMDTEQAWSAIRLANFTRFRDLRQQEIAFAKRRAASARYWFKLWLHGIA